MKIWRWHVIGGVCLINGFRVGAELGVSGGRFTTYICSHIEDMKMIAVDLWQPQPGHEAVEGGEHYEGHNLPQKYENFSAFCQTNFPDRVRIMRMLTTEAAKVVEDGSLDFVFIDADHSYEGCKADIEAWLSKVRKGGMISGHDYNWPTVARAVGEFFPRVSLGSDNVWMVSKI